MCILFLVLGVRCGLVGCRLDVGFGCARVYGLMVGRVLCFRFLGFLVCYGKVRCYWMLLWFGSWVLGS